MGEFYCFCASWAQKNLDLPAVNGGGTLVAFDIALTNILLVFCGIFKDMLD